LGKIIKNISKSGILKWIKEGEKALSDLGESIFTNAWLKLKKDKDLLNSMRSLIKQYRKKLRELKSRINID
jgi:hypothetical protein